MSDSEPSREPWIYELQAQIDSSPILTDPLSVLPSFSGYTAGPTSLPALSSDVLSLREPAEVPVTVSMAPRLAPRPQQLLPLCSNTMVSYPPVDGVSKQIPLSMLHKMQAGLMTTASASSQSETMLIPAMPTSLLLEEPQLEANLEPHEFTQGEASAILAKVEVEMPSEDLTTELLPVIEDAIGILSGITKEEGVCARALMQDNLESESYAFLVTFPSPSYTYLQRLT
ncbi:hypothetical protein K488DRAFT_73817 [Vararia minispora EC-137]|uniref:Uncharacterized protein n=1 Tax=Vararia minispora EC-137 TaxID=1314806 RepID=A0ACB8Q9Y3_9AGAM|nr:hypothetical protein K488DRAFT_73817 [Vararia minispora EC-137]